MKEAFSVVCSDTLGVRERGASKLGVCWRNVSTELCLAVSVKDSKRFSVRGARSAGWRAGLPRRRVRSGQLCRHGVLCKRVVFGGSTSSVRKLGVRERGATTVCWRNVSTELCLAVSVKDSRRFSVHRAFCWVASWTTSTTGTLWTALQARRSL